MTDLQELQKFATDREWQEQLSRAERTLIQSVVSVQSRQGTSLRYDPMFSYGSEKHETWRVTLADGSRKILDLQYGGNTDGLWFIMAVK
jgi:hypothetical protein